MMKEMKDLVSGKVIENKMCGDCGNFDRYQDENDGYGGCDESGYTVNESDSACDNFI